MANTRDIIWLKDLHRSMLDRPPTGPEVVEAKYWLEQFDQNVSDQRRERELQQMDADRQHQVDQIRIQMVEQKRLDSERKLQVAIDTGERKANVTRYRNQLAALPPVDQKMRDSLLRLRDRR